FAPNFPWIRSPRSAESLSSMAVLLPRCVEMRRADLHINDAPASRLHRADQAAVARLPVLALRKRDITREKCTPARRGDGADAAPERILAIALMQRHSGRKARILGGLRRRADDAKADKLARPLTGRARLNRHLGRRKTARLDAQNVARRRPDKLEALIAPLLPQQVEKQICMPRAGEDDEADGAGQVEPGERQRHSVLIEAPEAHRGERRLHYAKR